MMPILHCPGVMTPGQLGPTRRHGRSCRNRMARAMSSTGMPSVMATMSRTPASAASMMASAAPPGGTKTMLASAPVWRTASATVLNTGNFCFESFPSQVDPPRPGVTPPTNFDPYKRHWSVWKLPALPVIPWQMTRVDESTRMLMGSLGLTGRILDSYGNGRPGAAGGPARRPSSGGRSGIHDNWVLVFHRLDRDDVPERE